MSKARRGCQDDGSALIEFVVTVTLILLPTVYLILALGRIQAGAFATESAARHASMVIATAPDADTAQRRMDLVVQQAMRDQGFGPRTQVRTEVTCAPAACDEPETRITVEVSTQVQLPGLPPFLAVAVPSAVTVEASGTTVSQRFR
ncbi:MAG: pilus assembly protein TadE [Micrococcales bacterium]|nr:MAG: pilus assembly protein TadE [Micrococcales bacterium]